MTVIKSGRFCRVSMVAFASALLINQAAKAQTRGVPPGGSGGSSEATPSSQAGGGATLDVPSTIPSTGGPLSTSPQAAVAAAQAQEQAPPTATLSEVVVTAQKKAESLQRVPASVTALSAANLSAAGLNDFADFAASVPGLSISSAQAGFTKITLRGITTGTSQSSATTSFYIDEAPVGSVNAYAHGSVITPDLDPSTIQRIDVLKGPQGTLYGAGAVGGVFQYVTVSPDTVKFSGRLEADGDTVNHGGDGYALRGAVNIPLVSDVAALRINGFHREDPGYVENVVTGKREANQAAFSGGRIALLLKPIDHLKIDLSVLDQRIADDGTPSEDVTGATRQPIYGDLDQHRYTSEAATQSLLLYNGTITYGAGPVDLTSSTTYQTIRGNQRTDGTQSYGTLLGPALKIPNLGIAEDTQSFTKRISEEVRADSSLLGGRLTYQLGFYYTHEDDYLAVPPFHPFLTTTGAALSLPTLVTETIQSTYTEYSVFGNLDLYITPNFDILAGGRGSNDNQNYFQTESGLLVGKPLAFSNNNVSQTTGTYLVSPRYTLPDGSIAYARVASGFRPGGPNAVPPAAVSATAPRSFNPDTLTSYELGYKATYFDKKITFDAALFDTDWHNVQIETSAGGFNFFVNGGGANAQGGEGTLIVTPLRGFSVTSNVAYTNARLTDAAPAAGALAGDQQPFVPKWTGALSADYQRRFLDDVLGSVGATLSYIGERRSNYTNEAAINIPSYLEVGLRASVSYKTWTLDGFAKNLNDARGITAYGTETTNVRSLAANPFGAAIVQPRTFGFQLSKTF